MNSEKGEMKCVQHSGQAAVALQPKWEAGVALEPGETVIIKHTRICSKVAGCMAIYIKDLQWSSTMQTCTGQNIFKTKKLGEATFQTRSLCFEVLFKSTSKLKAI